MTDRSQVDDTTVSPIKVEDVIVDRTREKLRMSLPSGGDGLPDKTSYLLCYTRRM